MQKNNFYIFCFLFLLIGACKNKNNTPVETADYKSSVEKKPAVFPVTEFIKGQLHDVETLPVTPLAITTVGDKIDSVWKRREDIRDFAKPFLTPVIDSASLQSYFTSSSFFDQTINAITFMYDANNKLPATISLTHFDVYINPESGKVKRIYMVKKPSADSTIQLTWTADKWCSIVTLQEGAGKRTAVKEEKMIWKFD